MKKEINKKLLELKKKFIVPIDDQQLYERTKVLLDKGIKVVVDKSNDLHTVIIPHGLHNKDFWTKEAEVLYKEFQKRHKEFK